MITDEERREVAKRLRALDMSDIEVDGCIIDSAKYVGLLLMRMLDVACDYRDGLHHFPGFFSARAVVELFADLIDRPTTTRHGRFKTKYGRETPCCEVCGYSIGDMRWNYCPKCGAVITDAKR